MERVGGRDGKGKGKRWESDHPAVLTAPNLPITFTFTHRRSQDFLWGALTSFLKKVDDHLLLVAIKTQTKLTTPTLQISPAQQKFPQKLNSCFACGVHLQLFPSN